MRERPRPSPIPPLKAEFEQAVERSIISFVLVLAAPVAAAPDWIPNWKTIPQSSIKFSWNHRSVNAVEAIMRPKLNIKPPFGESGGFFVARRGPRASQTEISRRATSADIALRFHKLEVASVQPVDPDALALCLHRSAGAEAGSPAVDH